MLMPGAGFKLLLAGGGLTTGIALMTGAATGGTHQTALSARPDTVAALCRYASSPESGRPSARDTGGTPTAAQKQRQQAPRGGSGTTSLGLNAKQRTNAEIVISVATSERLPRRAAVIGIATALQESDLGLNLVGDHGTSFGLFHQKPTSGYGTRDQILDPHHAAQGFFSRLRKVPGWKTMPLTVAAQTVQRSSFPDAYAKHEDSAEKIVDAIGPPSPAPSPQEGPAAVRSGTRTTASRLSPDQQAELKSQVLMAAAENLPRDKAISTISASLRDMDSSDRPSHQDGARELETLVAEEFDAAAADYCRELATNDDKENSSLVVLDGSSRGDIAAQAAMKMLGVPYSWGGGGPNGPSRGIAQGSGTIGFDCSGLTEYAWAKAGVHTGGSTDPQWRSGVRVPRSQLRPGDLLFFATDPSNPATIHHVGINIDGQRMVHSPRTGRSVEITRWSGDPYREREFIGAVRPASRR